MELLFRELPNGDSTRHVNVQAANQTELRDLETLVDRLQKVDRDALLFLPQKQNRGLVERKDVFVERHTVGGLLDPDNVIAFGSALAQPGKKILRERGVTR